MYKNDGRLALRFAKITEECESASQAVKNIQPNGHDLSVRLSSNTNEFCTALQAAATAINYVVPSIQDHDYQDKMKAFGNGLININQALQHSIVDDFHMLKKKLETAVLGVKMEVESLTHLINDNSFIHHQMRQVGDEVLFSVYKLKHQALYFTIGAKELHEELDKAVQLGTQLNSMSTPGDSSISEEHRATFRYVTVLAARVLYKLENWLDINNNDVKASHIVQACADVVAKCSHKLRKITNGIPTITHIKNEFQPMVEKGYKSVRGFTEIDTKLNKGYEEFLRSVLFDGIVAMMWYRDALEITDINV